MRRSILGLLAAASFAAGSASPALAAKTIVSTLPAPVAACDPALTTPDAVACAGYYSGNLINGSPTDRQNQAEAIALLPGGAGVFDGSQAAWDALDPEFKITSGDASPIDFGVTLFGL